jgi:hypothetical protein
MKTPTARIKLLLRPLNLAGAALCLCLGLQQPAQAVNTTLNYTNVADAWLTTASWSPANNWNSGTVKTNATTADVRLNIGTNTTVNRAVTATYDASMGTTIFNNAGVATIGMVIGAGNTTTGAVNIVGGTLVIQSGTAAAGGLLIGNPNTAAQTPAGSGLYQRQRERIRCDERRLSWRLHQWGGIFFARRLDHRRWFCRHD